MGRAASPGSVDGRSPPAVGAKPFAGAPQDRADLVVTLPETPEALPRVLPRASLHRAMSS